MFDATELCRQVGIQQAALDAWIEAGWLRPERARNDWRFSTIDLVRAQFILDLSGPMGVNDEGVDVILGLLDQIHGLRRALLGVTSTMGGQKASSRTRQAGRGRRRDAEARKRPPRRGVADRATRGLGHFAATCDWRNASGSGRAPVTQNCGKSHDEAELRRSVAWRRGRSSHR